jgi:hypothetical protein
VRNTQRAFQNALFRITVVIPVKAASPASRSSWQLCRASDYPYHSGEATCCNDIKNRGGGQIGEIDLRRLDRDPNETIE